jgi:5'(3')-deoxyribonucleotidase
MKPVLYLDLDGVLVDFVAGALVAHKQDIPRLSMRWNFFEQYTPPMTEAEFWKDLGFDFWSTLPWTPEGKNFLAGLEGVFGDRIILLTSPADTSGAVEGKVEWVRRELPQYKKRLFVGPAKQLLAGPKKILVDDNNTNVERFRAEGGVAVLVPRPWNNSVNYCIPGTDGGFDVDALISEVTHERARLS